MRKSIITGVAGAAMCLSFTGCHQYDFTPISDGEAAYQNYENVFIEKYGEPAPDHTWGFGSTTKSGMTRAITPTYSFPSDADASKFSAAVPDGVEKRGSFASGIGYIDESYTDIVNIWGAWNGSATVGGTLYIAGINDFSGKKFYIAPNTDIYLVKGAKLTIESGNETVIQAGCNVYIAEDAELVLKTKGGTLTFACNIYNHGKIMADAFLFNNNGLLYNKGDVKVDGAISVENSNSTIVNDGNMSGKSLHTAGSSRFQNNGTATISGETLINSNNNTWVNNGQYTTGYFKFNAISDQVINNCRLNVSETFSVTLGDGNGGIFRMDGAAGVVAKNLKAAGPFRIEMGGKSVFKVTETAVFDAAKANYGVYGIGNDYAVFHANKIEAGTANQGYEVTYGGNLYVVANTTHFENGLSGANPYIDFKDGCTENNIYENGNVPAITINETSCNPGFQGNSTGSGPTPLRIIAEDLPASAGDFDFNDVVFDVQLNWPVTGKHTITLQAAGGTMPLYIGNVSGKEIEFSNGKPNYEGDYFEVHKAFGVETGKMVNTAEWTATKDPVTIVITGNYSNENEIAVRVKKGNDLPLLTAETGKVPSKLAVPATYKWCEELKNIEVVYGDKFKEYIGDPSVIWYEPTPETGVYNKK